MKTKNSSGSLLAACFLTLTACGGGSSGGNDPLDTSPDAFAFEPSEIPDAYAGQHVLTSASVTGFDGELTAKVTARHCSAPDVLPTCPKTRLSKNGRGEFGDSVTLSAGDTLDVAMTINSNAVAGDVFEATITLGEGNGAKSASIRAVLPDAENPELAVHFPPSVSMTDIPLPGIVTLRGSASDNAAVAGIFVNGAEATFDQATGMWTFDYVVQPGENRMEVQAVDASNNLSTPAVLILTHVADRMDGVNFGAGESFGYVRSVLWDGTQSRLLVAAENILAIDLASATRVTLSTIDGYGLLHDHDRDRYIAANFDSATASSHGVFIIDPETGAATPLSVKGDGGPAVDFHLINDLALSPDGTRLFAHIWASTALVDALLWEIDSDPASSSFGSRAVYSDEGFGSHAGLAVDEVRNRLLISDCDLKAIALDAPAGTLTQTVIARAEDFCVQEALIDGDVAWARHVRDSTDRVIKIDLNTGTHSVVSDLKDPRAGPTTLTDRGVRISADREEGLLFLPLAAEGPDQPNAVAAVDTHSGQRVIVAQSAGL